MQFKHDVSSNQSFSNAVDLCNPRNQLTTNYQEVQTNGISLSEIEKSKIICFRLSNNKILQIIFYLNLIVYKALFVVHSHDYNLILVFVYFV